MDDEYYMTDEEMRLFDEPESLSPLEMELAAHEVNRFKRMEHWEVIFSQELKNIKTNPPNSKSDIDPDLTNHPVIYEGSEIDMKALHELLQNQGLSDQEANYICNQVETLIPALPESVLTEKTKTRIIDIKETTTKLISKLSGLANENKKLIPYVESFSTYVDPVDFLSEVQQAIHDMLESYFPNEKVVRRAHLKFSHSLGHLWKLKLGKPTVYEGSPFVDFLSICTCSTQGATIKRIRRHKMKRRFKNYAPF